MQNKSETIVHEKIKLPPAESVTKLFLGDEYSSKKIPFVNQIGETIHCAVCEETFVDIFETRKHTMKEHIQSVHEGNKPARFNCATCDANFANESDLIRHRRDSRNDWIHSYRVRSTDR